MYMRHKFVLPNIVTTIGLSCGLFVIFRMCMLAPGEVDIGELRSSLLIILLAAFIDTLDGALARMMKVESDFGGFFDSMSDGITFGVAPAVLTLKAIAPEPGTFLGMMLYIGAMVFAVAGVLRLVRYSTMALAPQDPAHKGVFVGLPIPSAAIALSSLTVLILSSTCEDGLFSWHFAQMTVGILCFLLGYLMISRWRFPSLKALHAKYTSAQLLIFTACVTPIMLFLFLHNFVLSCVLVSCGYIFVSWMRALYYLIKGKRELAFVEKEETE